LRREHEANINMKTMLPNKNYSIKTLKRTLAKQNDWACLLIKIQNFENYKSTNFLSGKIKGKLRL